MFVLPRGHGGDVQGVVFCDFQRLETLVLGQASTTTLAYIV